MLFDTHAHIDDDKFAADRSEVIEKIRNSGVGLIVDVGADIESSKRAIALSEEYNFIYASVGVHPHDTEHMTNECINVLRELSKHPKVCAIGEIGLDYYYDFDYKDKQIKWFEAQMNLAHEMGKPVIIHDRDAHKDTMDILRACRVDKTSGVFHCFSGSVEMAKEALNLGMYISIAGPVTFKNAAKLSDVVKYVPLDRLFIETDSPYLSPEPLRGKRNDSSNLRYIAEKIAQIKGVSLQEIEIATSENGCRLFNIAL